MTNDQPGRTSRSRGGSDGARASARVEALTLADARAPSKSALFPALLLLAAPVGLRAEDVTFERHVRPILKAACFQCHGEDDKPKGKLDVRLPSLMARGGASGPA